MEPNAIEGNYKESKPPQVYSRMNLCTAEQVDEGGSISFLGLHMKLLILDGLTSLKFILIVQKSRYPKPRCWQGHPPSTDPREDLASSSFWNCHYSWVWLQFRMYSSLLYTSMSHVSPVNVLVIGFRVPFPQ